MKKKGKNVWKRVVAGVLTIAMFVTVLPVTKLETKAATTLNNPVIVADKSMEAGQKVTWDCVWFGSYPQTEIVADPSQCGTYGKAWEVENDYEIDVTLYEKLQSASYDSNGDTVISGVKYRRIKKEDAVFTQENSINYYSWSDSTTYHYFRYDPIKWRVLRNDSSTALLLADRVLDAQSYHTDKESVTWETSTIRSWLNGYGASYNVSGTDYSSKNFIDRAFSVSEQQVLKTITLVNDNNCPFATEGGNNTSDKVFLLSQTEMCMTDTAKSYGFTEETHNDEAKRTKSSTYAKSMGTWVDATTSYVGDCYWWLRSPGYITICALNVKYCGDVDSFGRDVIHDNVGVRPALNLDLSSNLWLYAGTVCSDGTVNESGTSGGGTISIPGKDLTHYTSGYGGSIANASNDEEVRKAFQELANAINVYMQTLNKSVKVEANTATKAKKLREYDQGKKQPVLTCGCDDNGAWNAAYAGLAEFYDRFEENPPNTSVGEIDISKDMTSIEAQIIKAIQYSIKTYKFTLSSGDYNVKVNVLSEFSSFSGSIEVTRKRRIAGETNSWVFALVSDVDNNVKNMVKYYKDLCDTAEQVVKDGLKEYLKALGRVTCITQITQEEFTSAMENIVDYMKANGYGNVTKYAVALYDGYRISKGIASLTNSKNLSQQLSEADELYKTIKDLDFSDSSVKDKAVKAALELVQEKKQYLSDILYNYIYHPDEKLDAERNGIEKAWNDFWSWYNGGKKITAQCPVTLEVYDENQNLLGIAEDGYFECSDAIYIEVNGDVKTIYIPDTLNVTLKMTGTASGSMIYTVEEFEQGVPIGRLNYYNVPLTENGIYMQTMSSGKMGIDTTEYPLTVENGEEIKASEYISVNDDAICKIGCESSEGGTVYGIGEYAKGDKVELYAYSEEGYQFEGWYDGDFLLEVNNTYRMTALDDTTIQAVFSLIPKPQEIVCENRFEKLITDKTFPLNASATGNGKLHYFSENDNIAEVDTNGNVTLKQTGQVNIFIASEGTSGFKETSKTVPLKISCNHDYEVVESKVDCLQGNSTTYVCNVCKDTHTVQEKATGHKGEWIITKKATYLAVGSKTRTCTICGTKETASIGKLCGTSFKSLKNKKRKKAAVSWKKNSKVTGYQVQYSLYPNFKGAKTKTVKGAKKTSYTLSKLKKGKTYYVRVRTYTKKNYSGWSNVKKVKIKK